MLALPVIIHQCGPNMLQTSAQSIIVPESRNSSLIVYSDYRPLNFSSIWSKLKLKPNSNETNGFLIKKCPYTIPGLKSISQALKESISKYSTVNLYSRSLFVDGYATKSLHIHTITLALNDSDIPPIVADGVKADNFKPHKQILPNIDSSAPSPYSSRSLIYIQPRKPTKLELQSIEEV